jgi:LysM repeat protein
VAAGTGTAARGENEIFVVAALDLAEPREDGSIVHTVQSGQSLWSIAARYGVPLQDVLLFNSLSEDSTINPGDEVTIRLADGAEPPPPPTTYIVRSGDNAWTIAARFRLTLEDFLWYNSMSEDSLIQPGDVVKIGLAEGEAPPPTPTPQLAHVVRSGETLWDISLRYGLTVEQLLTLNGLSESAVLSVGQEVYIRETPQPVPTETPFPPTFTPIPPSAGPAEVVIVANPNGPTPTPTTTPLALAANVADGPATPRPGSQPGLQDAALATGSAPGWMVAAGVGTFALALLLMVGVIVLAVRKM